MWADKRFKQKWLLKYVLNDAETDKKTQGLHVLKKLSGVDGPVVKLVTDGHISIPAEFTPSALHQFSQSSEPDSPMQWDRCWIIVKKYSLKFTYAASLESCDLRLLIDDFSFWVSEEGFRLKEDPIPCLELPTVKSKVKTMWQDQRLAEAEPSQSLTALSVEMSSLPLSALLSQMNKDSQAVSTQTQTSHTPLQNEGSHSGTGASLVSEGRATTSKLVPESRPKSNSFPPAEIHHSLTNDLIDIRRFLISQQDVKTLAEIPEWQPGYIVPPAEPQSTEDTTQGEQESSSSILRKGISKITNRTLAGGTHCSPDSAASSSDDKQPSEKHPSHVGTDKPPVTNCNISVQVGDSLLCQPVLVATPENTSPNTRECSAQVGSSLLQNTEPSQLSQDTSQSQEQCGIQVKKLPSDIIFHPYFLGETNSTTEKNGNLGFKEPCLPQRLQPPNQQLTEKAAVEESSFVASTQIDRAETVVLRPNFQMSPVLDSQADPRSKDCEMPNDVSFNDDSKQTQVRDSESKSVEITSPVKESAIVMQSLDSHGDPAVDMCNTKSDNIILGENQTPSAISKDKGPISIGDMEAPASLVQNAVDLPEQNPEVRETVSLKDSQENLCENVLSDLGQKLSTTPENSSCGSGTQEEALVAIGQSRLEPNIGQDVSEVSVVMETVSEEEISKHVLDTADTAEDERLQELAKVDKEHSNVTKSSEQDHTRSDRDGKAKENVQLNSPFGFQSPCRGNFRMPHSPFMGLGFTMGNPAAQRFGVGMSPEERRLEMMKQVMRHSEAYAAKKENSGIAKVLDVSEEKEQEKHSEDTAEEMSRSNVPDGTEEASDEDLVVEKVIRRKNTNSSGNTSIDCSTAIVLKVEPASDSESANEGNRKKSSRRRNTQSTVNHQAIEDDVHNQADTGNTNLIVEVEVHHMDENNGVTISQASGDIEESNTEMMKEPKVMDKDASKGDSICEESSSTEQEQNSGTETTGQSSPDARPLHKPQQKTDVAEDILTLDTSCTEMQDDVKKEKRKTSKPSAKQKREKVKVSESDEEEGLSCSKSVSASSKKRTRNKKAASSDEDGDDWMPSPAKQGRAKTRASQPRFSFSKTKSVSENIQDMLTSKKSGQLDSSVLFAEKTPTGKSTQGKMRASQARRSSKKHRLYNEGGGMMLLSEVPAALESVLEEEQTEEGEAEKIVTRSRRNKKNSSSTEDKIGNALNTELKESEMVEKENMLAKSHKVRGKSEEEICTYVDKTLSETPAPSRTVKGSSEEDGCDDVFESSNVLEDNTTPEREKDSTTVKTNISEEALAANPVVFMHSGMRLKVSQPVVLLEPVIISDSLDVILSEETQQKLKEFQEANLNRSFTQTGKLEVEITGDRRVSGASPLKVDNASFSPETIPGNQEELYPIEPYHPSCDAVEIQVFDSDKKETIQKDSENNSSDPAEVCNVEKPKAEVHCTNEEKIEESSLQVLVENSEAVDFDNGSSANKPSLIEPLPVTEDIVLPPGGMDEPTSASHVNAEEEEEIEAGSINNGHGGISSYSDSSKCITSPNKSVEGIQPTGECAIKETVQTPKENTENSSASQIKCEESIQRDMKELNSDKRESSETVTGLMSPCEKSEHMTQHADSTEGVDKSPTRKDRSSQSAHSAPLVCTNNNDKAATEAVASGNQDCIEKLLEYSVVDETSPPFGSEKYLSFPTPDMSLQCGQRSRQSDCHLSQSQGHLEVIPAVGLCDLEVAGPHDAGDMEIMCNLQKMLDEEIEKDDGHKLLSFRFTPETESSLRSYFGLEQ